jgi:hypothetical protein
MKQHVKLATPSGPRSYLDLHYITSKLPPPLANTCSKHVKLATPAGQHFHTYTIPLQNGHPFWQIHTFSRLCTSTSQFPPPLNNTFIRTFIPLQNCHLLWTTHSYLHHLTSYHFKIAAFSGRYIHFRVYEQAGPNSQPPLDNTFILTLYHFKIATLSGKHMHFHIHNKHV